MININIKNFILTGEWGPIKLGMTRNEVVNKIGEPENWDNAKGKNHSVIWRYGNIEFYFCMSGTLENKDKLEMIFTDYLYNLSGGNTFNLDKWFFKKYKQNYNKIPNHLQLKKVKKLMNKQKIKFELIEKKYSNFKLFDMIFISGVKLAFEKNHNENLVIDKNNEDKLYFCSALNIYKNNFEKDNKIHDT